MPPFDVDPTLWGDWGVAESREWIVISGADSPFVKPEGSIFSTKASSWRFRPIIRSAPTIA